MITGLFRTRVDRLWVPIEEVVTILEGGYLPELEYWSAVPAIRACRPLTDYASSKCLILLGEPGLGKTTALLTAYETDISSNQPTAFLDLASIETTSEIRDSVPPSISGRTNMYFDSLDEGRLSIKQLFTRLVPVLNQLSPEIRSQLYVRLTCRTSEWSERLDQELRTLFGPENVDVLQLTPLRESDVRTLVSAEGVNAERFLLEVDRTGIEALAARPITLSFLIDVFREGEKFPERIADLYDQGLKHLATEHSRSRKDYADQEIAVGTLSSSERLSIAKRIASCSVLSNRPNLELNDISSDKTAIGFNELVGETIEYEHASLTITKQSQKEVLHSGLFTSVSPQTVRWAHRGFAEYLAARDLIESGLPLEAQHELLASEVDPNGAITPQLYGVATWLGSIEPSYLKVLAQVDPDLVIKADLAAVEPDIRAHIVDSYLASLESGRTHDFTFDLWRHYAKLKNPKLADQLRLFVTDSDRHFIARRAAIDIAKATSLGELKEDLLSVALNGSEDRHIRKSALGALASMNDREIAASVASLTKLSPGEDPDDEIRGASLQLAWPTAMSTSDMLVAVDERPRRENFLGAYRHFLSTFPTSIPTSDLPIVLAWLKHKVESAPDHGDVSFDMERLANRLVARSAKELPSQSGLLAPLAELVAALLTNGSWHDWMARGDEGVSSLFGTTEVRRQLASEVLRGLRDNEAFWVVHHSLLTRDDVDFVLSELTNASEDADVTRWDAIAWVLLEPTDHLEFESYYDAATKHDCLRDQLKSRFGPIELGSEMAAELREYDQRIRALESRPRKEQLKIEAIDQWIDDALVKVTSGKNTDAWTACFTNGWFQYDPDPEARHNEDRLDLISLPSYTRASEERRRVFLDAAKRYVVEAPTDTDVWWDTTNELGWHSLAALAALVLIQCSEPEFNTKLSRETWMKWLPIIIREDPHSEVARQHRRELYRQGFHSAPDHTLSLVRERVELELSSNPEQARISLAEILPPNWTDEVIGLVKDVLKDPRLFSGSRKSGIVELFRHNQEVAEDFCVDVVEKEYDGSDRTDRLEMAAACVAGILEATQGSAWPAWRDRVLGDTALLKETLCHIGWL